MPDRYAVVVEGLEDAREAIALSDSIALNAARAINRVAASGRTEAGRRILREVKLPGSYLNPSAKRLYVSRKATRRSLEGIITARRRPTSLARYVIGNPKRGEGVTVEVRPGQARYMRRAFLVRLPAGNGPVDTKSNLGLAVRLRPGQTMDNKTQTRRLANGLYLLYGPSVQQVFIDNAGGGVAEDLSPKLASKLGDEFLRLMDL